MTNERRRELADLCRQHMAEIFAANKVEYARADYGQYDYVRPMEVFAEIDARHAERKAKLEVTQDEWDIYECEFEAQEEAREALRYR